MTKTQHLAQIKNLISGSSLQRIKFIKFADVFLRIYHIANLQNLRDPYEPGHDKPVNCLRKHITLKGGEGLSGPLTKFSSPMTFSTESNISLWTDQIIHLMINDYPSKPTNKSM